MTDLPSLSYTERVLSESMRLYPPAWIVGRRALEDHQIDGYANAEVSLRPGFHLRSVWTQRAQLPYMPS